MANGLFIPHFRGTGSPGVAGAGSTRRGLQLAESGSLKLQGTRDQARIDSIIQGAVQLKNIADPERKLAFLQQRKQELERSNIDTTDTDEAIELATAGDFAGLEEVTDQAISLGQKGVSAKTQAETGKLVAETGKLEEETRGLTLPKPVTAKEEAETGKLIAETEKIQRGDAAGAAIPDVLLEDLEPEIANKGAAAFKAAGGGSDGLKAFSKVVDEGTELQRRQASPQILKTSFPQASPAELNQLQGVMDSAKTTATGLAAAGKVRAEQRRMKKAQGFQVRAVDLLNTILENDELDDVLGSVEGAIDFRFQDSEAELIADIEEASNILTADNMDLMTGVLSESDIKILKNLSGGGLNRKRSPKRFIDDITKIRDKLSKEQVVTIDQQRGAASTNTVSIETQQARLAELRAKRDAQ